MQKRARDPRLGKFGSVHQTGAALLITLAFVVLLTVLAVAFFTRATSERQVAYTSANQSKTELLARGALAITIGDLKQEIASGSTIATVQTASIYYPKRAVGPAPATVTPAVQGPTGTNGLESLVKRSAYGVPFYPSNSSYDTATYPASNRAAGPSSKTATTLASQNGRFVSLARWNKPLLLQKATLSSDTDITPVGGFVPPDWILSARDGSNPTTWSPNLITSPNLPSSIVGRYAYTIYDEGGLIDMNVAGYPTVSTNPQVGRKGLLAYADLKQIPGVSSLSALSQTKFVNNIVGWRNFASGGATGSLGTFASGTTYSFASGDNYYSALQSNRNGFLLTSNSVLSGNQSDRMFGSRQELTTLLLRGMASSSADRANLQVALQYLGTFSRELNRPTWAPAPITAINPDLQSVRVAIPFTRSDGTTAVLGEPLMKTRFALPRLNELTNTANPNIQRDFGLKWDGSNNRWDYVGASGSTVQSTIRTLSGVAGEVPGREPNFFEVLKAVITNGSVGLGSGALNTFVASEAKYYNTAGGLSADYQIMQIGANIIDAWDSDNIPTFINIGGNELAGVENLPYLNKLVLSFLFTNNGHGDLFYSWLLPSLWNPHQNAASAPATQDVRFAMTTGSVNAVVQYSDSSPTFVTDPVPSPSPGVPFPYIQVKANAFRAPCPPVPSPAASPAPANESGTPPKVGQVSATTVGLGYYDGLSFGVYADPSGGNNSWKNVDKVYPIFAAGTTFEMQVNINGTWKAYQTWKGCNNGTQAAPLLVSQGAKKSRWKDNAGFKDPEFVALDPRTVRFGIWGSDGNATGNDTNYDMGAEDTMDEGATGLELVSALTPQPAASFPSSSGKNYYNYASNTVANERYADLDGVFRRADWTTDASGTVTKKTIMYAVPSPSPSPTPPNSQDRPQILSTPFQSVAELGQVFRDQPWKTLSFSTAASGDAGLLDVFTLQDVPMVAGRASLNTRQIPVLTAILSQAIENLAAGAVVGKTGTYPITFTPADITTIVTRLTALTAANPMINKAELVTRLMEDATISPTLSAALWAKATTNPWNKESREIVTRALSDATQTRTWNLMIDVIAQSGRYPPTATNLTQFVVEGEKRYWLHIAIDRFTGEVIDQQLEAVYE